MTSGAMIILFGILVGYFVLLAIFISGFAEFVRIFCNGSPLVRLAVYLFFGTWGVIITMALGAAVGKIF